jgi:rare lipoprotein A
MRLPVNHALPLAALLLIALSGEVQAKPAEPGATAPTGPAADYPVTVGEPYTIGKTTWTPSDQLNYDAVGLAGAAGELGGVAAAHKTLPVPSYAEVTALDSGRTILVRIIERGPADNDTLVALSPAALTQLGLAPGSRAAVRVRRVNPPEVERAALRTGGTAPLRMETPESLLKVLRRKLAEQSPLMPPPSMPPAMPANLSTAQALPSAPLPKPKTEQAAKPLPTSAAKPVTPVPSRMPAAPAKAAVVPAKAPAPANTPKATAANAPAAKGTHVVQVAAFSTRERADKAARALGGMVTPAGRLWRVRMGPFSSTKDARSALEKAKAGGYSDARIQRAD